ncbi:hypothetical protein GSI_01265 [Ganoderma sinense ZZ0214-1]|uniref:Uncharacterized protein n=1 Tax=Ganoderma sinense ZZ0214-1 TaxID=1077348 RepID=A0A2G8SUW4_9APHY|nr:hypothetical protein GSI_01265 [Ganoderma sinense ZZ0214-1]
MGQNWEIFNVDRRERRIGSGGKLSEFFFDNMPSLYEALRIPCLPKAVDKWLSRGTFVMQPGPVGKLSTEVLDMVFEAILDNATPHPTDNFLNCIFLAVGCKRLLVVCKRHILRALISRHARAADCRLVCLGSSAYGAHQAPPGMLTDAELQEIATKSIPGEDEYYGSAEKAMEARRLYSFACECYKPYREVQQSLFDPLRERAREFGRIRREKGETIDPLYALELDMITALGAVDSFRPKPEYPYPAEGPNVLCNMSKGEYVREDVLLACETGFKWERIALVNALLSQICYSPDGGAAVGCEDKDDEERLVRGPWAGDRFRITSAAEMPLLKLKGGKEWKDVTEELAMLLSAVHTPIMPYLMLGT